MHVTILALLCILKDFLLSLDILRKYPVLNICWQQKQFLQKMSLNFGLLWFAKIILSKKKTYFMTTEIDLVAEK